MEPKFYRWALGLTALALGVMLAFAVWRTPRPPVEVEAVRAACEDVFNTVTVKGTVRARREDRLCVYAPARVETVYAAPGDTVTAGEPLFRVSYTGLDVPADAAAAVSALFDGADEMAETVDGQVVYAGLDGTAAQLPRVGDQLLPGVTAARVADLSRLTVEAKVPELYAGELSSGQRANLTPVSSPDTTLSATLDEIAPYAVQTFQLTGGTAGATVLCTLSLNEPADGLLPGSTVDVKLFTDEVKDAVTVPYAAVRQEDGQEYVFVLADGVVRRRDIETGYQLSRGVQVTRGLEAGAWVVTDGEAALTDGERAVRRAAR